MSAYTSEYPPVDFDPAYKKFFEDFYATSDTPEAHEKYIEHFTNDATLIMASKKVVGSDQILALRKGMWEKVSSRSHAPLKIFPFGANSDTVMLYGTVKYGLKAGGESMVDWAARAHLVKDGGTVKMDFYQVYLDTGAQAK
ncbi:Nn.00g025350.m01.CDS01 [Neocucurbitaria sp. VM-36]